MPRFPLVLVVFIAGLGACRPSKTEKGGGSEIVGRYANGVVTEAELRREKNKLPAEIQSQLSQAGQSELVRSMIDKRLLVEEAKRRGFDADADVKRQVRELEERLMIQALLTAEERAAAKLTDAELRAYYEAHARDFTEPDRFALSRVLIKVSPTAPSAEKKKARQRIARIEKRLRSGEPMAKVASAGEGPERLRAGDLGVVTTDELNDPALSRAALALAKPGASSEPIEGREGWAVLQLRERRPGRLTSFEEARAKIEGHLLPMRQRKIFDQLLVRLRKSADVHVDVAAR